MSYIADASVGVCHRRDEIKSRSSSILDHFPNVGRINIEQIQSKHRPILLSYTSEHLLYIWVYGYCFCNRVPMLTSALVIVETKSNRGRVPSWTIFPMFDKVMWSDFNRSIDGYSLDILQNTYSTYVY